MDNPPSPHRARSPPYQRGILPNPGPSWPIGHSRTASREMHPHLYPNSDGRRQTPPEDSAQPARGHHSPAARQGVGLAGRAPSWPNIRFDHGFECRLPLPLGELVDEVARHAGRLAVKPEEAVVVGQGPSGAQGQRVGHAGVRLQLLGQVGQLRGDVCRGGEAGGYRGWPQARSQPWGHCRAGAVSWYWLGGSPSRMAIFIGSLGVPGGSMAQNPWGVLQGSP